MSDELLDVDLDAIRRNRTSRSMSKQLITYNSSLFNNLLNDY